MCTRTTKFQKYPDGLVPRFLTDSPEEALNLYPNSGYQNLMSP